jgi:hypothetical protein
MPNERFGFRVSGFALEAKATSPVSGAKGGETRNSKLETRNS